MKKKNQNGMRPFGFLDNLSYAAGDFACNMSFALKGTLVIFWTQYMGLNSLVYAGLLLVVQIWDAINDPIIGAWFDADHKAHRMNKFKLYILIGAIGLILAGALCFIPLPNAPMAVKNILFIAGYMLWDAFYTIANVPYGTMLSAITEDSGERAALSTWRSLGSLIANIVTTALIPVLCYDAANNLMGEKVFTIALILGGLGFLAFAFMLKTTVIRVQDNFKASEERPKFNVWKAFGAFFRNRAAVGCTIAAMAMFIGMQAANAAVTVLFQSYFHNVQLSGVISLFSMIPVIVLAPFIRRLAKRYGKKEIVMAGALFSTLACLLMLVLPITPDGTGLLIYTVCCFLNSFGIGTLMCLVYSMVADAIDYNEWKFNNKDEGTTYALHSFFRKLAQGVGPSLALVIMVWLGYVEADQGNQAAAVATNMRYFVPALYLFAAVLVVVSIGLIYNIDKNKLAEMNEALGRTAAVVPDAPAPAEE